jgi:hypothetical protein
MLRSMKNLENYVISATDGDIGHLRDFYFDDDAWVVRYFVVNAGNWLDRHKVLIAPQWITGVHWNDQTVSVDLSRESIKGAPHYDPTQPWSREQDERLYQHYRRTGFWAGNARLETQI